MLVAGACVRCSGERYDAALVVLDDTRVIEHTHVVAPSGESESSQLENLNIRAHEFLRPHSVGRIVLWPPDLSGSGGKHKATLVAGRGEGAILSAAGRLGIASDIITGAGVRAAAGKGLKTAQAIVQLVSAVSGAPADEAVRRAVVAARVWMARNP